MKQNTNPKCDGFKDHTQKIQSIKTFKGTDDLIALSPGDEYDI